MSLGVEEGIQRKALKAVQEYGCESKDGIDTHGNVDQLSEDFGCKSKVEEEEGNLDDKVHPSVHDFLSKETLNC
jgi:hypothetical protein